MQVQRQFLENLTPEQLNNLTRDWRFWARDEQILPAGDWWDTWAIIAGRGWGKTRTGAETVLDLVEQGYRAIGLIGRTVNDVRNVMVEGPLSGIMACAKRRGHEVVYEPSKRRLVWSNGAKAFTYSGDKPDQLRGPEHDAIWCDELAAWRYPETWDMALLGLRIGWRPLALVTTTPRPVPHVKELLAATTTLITRGRTLDNAANLSRAALNKLLTKYKGTRLGLQELEAIILTDTPGALWQRAMLELLRVKNAPPIIKVAVGVDPEASDGEDSASTGIVVVGIDAAKNGYVLDDVTVQGSPATWAKAAIAAYERWGAEAIVAEANNGGDMVVHTLRSVLQPGQRVPRILKAHASDSKKTRAEPVSTLYEQGRIYHVGAFAELEDQMCTWVPGDKSPDRLDAMVWGFTHLLVEGGIKRTAVARAKGLPGR